MLSALYGAAVFGIGIWLESRGQKLESQIFVMTAIALLGPIGIGAVKGAFFKTWFWVAVAFSAVLHIAFLWRVWHSLPFSGMGVAIILGTIECFVLLFASAKVLDISGEAS